MKKIKQILYIVSVVLPIIDAISGTISGLKKGIKQAGNERFEKEQEERRQRIKPFL